MEVLTEGSLFSEALEVALSRPDLIEKVTGNSSVHLHLGLLSHQRGLLCTVFKDSHAALHCKVA